MQKHKVTVAKKFYTYISNCFVKTVIDLMRMRSIVEDSM